MLDWSKFSTLIQSEPRRFVIATKKEIAVSFLALASSGQVDQAFEKYISPQFRHHNPYFKGDSNSLRESMRQNAAQFPNKNFKTLRALEDGELVAVHSLVKLKPEDRGIIVIHLFRFAGNFIVEEWEAGAPVPETSPNENGVL